MGVIKVLSEYLIGLELLITLITGERLALAVYRKLMVRP
jgi:hypothetical protein